jgi:phosphocarrier protein HPr
VSQASRDVTICNRKGLHARASMVFVTMATNHPVSVTVTKGGKTAPATSIMSLLMLGAATGESITISAEGPGAEDAVNALAELVETRFGEKD